jgi:Domain of unknown function (DUF4276)
MRAKHLELLVEEPSMEMFLRGVLPRLLPADISFSIFTFQGKSDLLGKLGERLRGYSSWLPEDSRVVVLVDRDSQDCHLLKQQLDDACGTAFLRTRSNAGGQPWQVVNRISVEELESWYFGDWAAVQAAYPRVPKNIPLKAKYRDPDAVLGGTCEAFERVLRRAGYFPGGLRKVEAARMVSKHIDPAQSSSRSFAVLREAILEAVATEHGDLGSPG